MNTSTRYPCGTHAAAGSASGIRGISLAAAFTACRGCGIVWSGGNDRLWDVLSVQSAGILDFLKTISNHPSIKNYSRDNRWQYLGLVNEPCFDKGNGPRKDRYGLWLDVRSEEGIAEYDRTSEFYIPVEELKTTDDPHLKASGGLVETKVRGKTIRVPALPLVLRHRMIARPHDNRAGRAVDHEPVAGPH